MKHIKLFEDFNAGKRESIVSAFDNKQGNLLGSNRSHLYHLLKKFSDRKFSNYISHTRKPKSFWDKMFDGLNGSDLIDKFLTLPEVKEKFEILNKLVKKHKVSIQLDDTLKLDDKILDFGISVSLDFDITGEPEDIMSFLSDKRIKDVIIFRINDSGYDDKDLAIINKKLGKTLTPEEDKLVQELFDEIPQKGKQILQDSLTDKK